MKLMAGKLTENHLRRMCIPPNHWGCTLAQIPETVSHKEFILDWVSNIVENIQKARGLLLIGPYGVGKSGCASICLKAAAAHGLIGYWISARRLPEAIIQRVWFDDDMTVIQRAESAPLLVIDEVQIRDQIAYSEQAVEGVVRKRIDEGLCTILTSNHGKDEMVKKYPALSAALLEAVVPVFCTGHNFREEIAKEWASS